MLEIESGREIKTCIARGGGGGGLTGSLLTNEVLLADRIEQE